MTLGDQLYYGAHGRKSDRMTVLNCPSIRCANGTTLHTITVAHGLRSYTCKQCGSVKRSDCATGGGKTV